MDNIQQEKLKIWWDEKEGIIRERLVGNLNEEDAKRSGDEINRLAVSLGKKGIKVVNFLVDATRAGIASTKARDVFSEELKKSKVDRVAVFEGGIIQKQ